MRCKKFAAFFEDLFDREVCTALELEEGGVGRERRGYEARLELELLKGSSSLIFDLAEPVPLLISIRNAFALH